MRENKYRIWDEKVKRYVQDEDWYYLSDDGELWNIYSYYYEMSTDLCDPERYIIEQYTGLLDKNGVKIFEGDIVVAWSVGHRAVGEVKKRIDGLWIMYPAYQKGKLWGLCPDPKGETSVEIIGNIHENPELLENS